MELIQVQMTTNDEIIHAGLAGQMLLFGFLGLALQGEPDRSRLNEWIAAEVFSEAPFGGEQGDVRQGMAELAQWTQENAPLISDAAYQALREDRLRLLVGMGPVLAPPWESVYFSQERLLFQEETLQVRQWYARFGLEVERLYHEPDDHIGLEYSFLAHLASLGLQAAERGDAAELADLRQAQAEFVSQHLLRWEPAWARLMLQHAHTDFYRGLAQLAHGALLALAGELQLQLPQAEAVL